jgi:hypothetical protein
MAAGSHAISLRHFREARMKSIVPLLLIFYFLSAGHALVHAQRIVYPDFIPNLAELSEEEKTKILKFFKKIKNVRETIYGNMHAVFECTSVTNIGNERKHSKHKYEYWAKDYQFYRIDATTLESSTAEHIGKVHRTVVRPEGAAILIQLEPGDWFRLAHVYDTKDGYDSITSLPIYQTSTLASCLEGITLAEIWFLKELNGVQKQLEHIQFEGDRCQCTISSKKAGEPFVVDFSFDIEAGVCLTLNGTKQQGAGLIYRRNPLRIKFTNRWISSHSKRISNRLPWRSSPHRKM